MSGVIGTLIGILLVGAAVYGPVRVLLSRRYPRKPGGTSEYIDGAH
ncbi:hypothetical protein SAMN05216377_12110 [Pseudonocardia oroxyli]|uniref:Uncharacterized protein n=1 Tax=Pseudonocardia oroxyli TaxID=366584 RepID=A0A1G8BDV4_PSEOR|nr:hypothetical protein SAMN05216377_12110 [Pseudonocardia oroxyli]